MQRAEERAKQQVTKANMTTSDITTFLESQAARIRELEAKIAELEAELEKEPVYCEYRGIEFWITELDPGYTMATNPYYGYHLRGNGRGNEGGGAYATKHEATKAAFARIETLTFDR
jgi:hypothetical protein